MVTGAENKTSNGNGGRQMTQIEVRGSITVVRSHHEAEVEALSFN